MTNTIEISQCAELITCGLIEIIHGPTCVLGALRIINKKASLYTEGKSLAIYFEDSRFRRKRIFNFIVSKIYVDKRSRVR